MQISQRGPERQVDPMERARDNANRAKENLANMPHNRTDQVNNNLNGCWLNTRCQQIWNGNINIGWQEWYVLQTGWVQPKNNHWNNPQNNINNARQYANWWNINSWRFNIATNQRGVHASGRWASNSVWQIGWD